MHLDLSPGHLSGSEKRRCGNFHKMGCWPEQTAFDHQEHAKLDGETEELHHNWVALEVGRVIRMARYWCRRIWGQKSMKSHRSLQTIRVGRPFLIIGFWAHLKEPSTSTPGQGLWVVNWEGAKGKMNMKPQNQCILADLIWLVPRYHRHQHGSPYAAELNTGCQPCLGAPSSWTCLLSNKTLQSVCFSSLFCLPTPKSQIKVQNTTFLSQGIGPIVAVFPGGAEWEPLRWVCAGWGGPIWSRRGKMLPPV